MARLSDLLLGSGGTGGGGGGPLTAPSRVYVHTGNGNGSASNIRRYTTVEENTGTDITYTDSATDGASFTINTTGWYAFANSYNTNAINGNSIVTLNQTDLTLTPANIPKSEWLGSYMYDTQSVSSQSYNNGSGMVYLQAGDVVRYAVRFAGLLQAARESFIIQGPIKVPSPGLIAEEELTVLDNEINITGLDLNADEAYRIRFNVKNDSGAEQDFRMLIDPAGDGIIDGSFSNYSIACVVSANISGAAGSPATDATISRIVGNDTAIGEIYLTKDLNNYVRAIIASNLDTAFVDCSVQEYRWKYNASPVTNVTAIRFRITNNLSIGSKIKVYKL